ncbi:MAG: heavy metal translocating P-type ATPase [Synergistaceae bacterium]|jgi:Cd2+/Zn2+-exporting ATPase|nr:heavy metal translocating P-type ATPase [Synergistaceae bacterium]
MTEKNRKNSAADIEEHGCGCSCCEEFACEEPAGGDENESENSSEWLDFAALGIGGLMLAAGLLGGDLLSEGQLWLLYGAPYVLCGYPVLLGACSSVRRGRFFDEFTLMGGATLAAIALGEPAEALGVVIFYQVGEMFQERAAGSSRRSIKNLLAAKPVTAHVLRGDALVSMPPEDVTAGMKVLVKPGERIPVDGLVAAGESRVDTSPITGEPVPIYARQGTKVFGGTVNVDGTLTVEASGPFADSSIARVMEMVENAVARKSPTERFISRFAAVYTPAMFGVAFLTAVLPPLLTGAPWHDWIYRALVVLMISCPCALVISIPLGYFGGIGAASKRGILVKGGNVLDAMNEISAVAFDKTGTLTRGVFEVTDVRPAPGVSEDDLERSASAAESLSNHPVARSIQKAFGALPPAGIDSREIAGKGVVAVHEGTEYAAGNLAMMEARGLLKEAESLSQASPEAGGTVVYVAKGPRFMGRVTVSDVLKADALRAVADLKALGVKSYMLTGDREEGASWVARKLNLDGYRSGLLPDMKVTAMAELAGAAKTAFVGDGVNDAPLLAGAHVGVAMGGLGSEVAVEVADAVVLNDAPSRVADLLSIARRTNKIVRENIVMALATKAVFMLLGVAGLAGLWEALFADVGVALLAILNSSRAVGPGPVMGVVEAREGGLPMVGDGR